jgi:hypothetical protein
MPKNKNKLVKGKERIKLIIRKDSLFTRDEIIRQSIENSKRRKPKRGYFESIKNFLKRKKTEEIKLRTYSPWDLIKRYKERNRKIVERFKKKR